MSSQSSLSDRFKRPSPSVKTQSNHSMFNAHHATVDCPECHRIMVPRVITYYGQPTKSICPFCGATFARFPSGLQKFLQRFHTRTLTTKHFNFFSLAAGLFGLTFMGSSKDMLPETLSTFALFGFVTFTALALSELVFQCIEQLANRLSHESNYYWATLVFVAWVLGSINNELTVPIIMLSFALILRGLIVGFGQILRNK
ncbi:hypothetical protein ACQE3D_18540 [Methylomonas sp. MS20]|uniref:hypothetical protein n=1 Tax=unclassified Methylomonas TaxID=2608980 RepID=UPI0028A39259|nr:hypothetical protein [Methylomonas sp. MV1]MDT4330806.1 hypothetical protein [Methylomonas sp. MV1]